MSLITKTLKNHHDCEGEGEVLHMHIEPYHREVHKLNNISSFVSPQYFKLVLCYYVFYQLQQGKTGDSR